ncbi:MAG TPA: hypothetical protein VHQ65_01455 [Thermoanaerobaculia bacterium]|nr:hypothetical protein [Thermoanaerobaculia bacterium]
MRKRMLALAVVFGATFGLGFLAPAPAAAAGGGSCYYTCDCAGRPIKCCPNLAGGVSCKLDSTAPIQCPQVYNC